MLVKLAEAIGRLVLAGREMSRLAGFTTRMDELIRVLKDLNGGKYERTMVSNSASADSDIGVGKGLISFQDNIIKFDKVPLVTPNGDLLVKDLSFEVRSGTSKLYFDVAKRSLI
jgi:ATP-binding cassette subfamily D (ALD) protein 3